MNTCRGTSVNAVTHSGEVRWPPCTSRSANSRPGYDRVPESGMSVSVLRVRVLLEVGWRVGGLPVPVSGGKGCGGVALGRPDLTVPGEDLEVVVEHQVRGNGVAALRLHAVSHAPRPPVSGL